MPSGYQQYFKTLAQVAKAIHSGVDTQDVLARIAKACTTAMAAKGSIFWIIDEQAGQIAHKVSHGFDFRSLSLVDLPTLQALFPPDMDGLVFIEDARYDERLPDLERLGKRRIRSVIGVPVSIVDHYSGILAVYFSARRSLARSEVDFLTALAEQGAIALHKALRYDERLLDAFRQTVEGLALALEANHPETHGHSLNVARLARVTAGRLGLSQARDLYQAGLLHDLGKIATSRKILERLGRLSGREMDLIRDHPVVGARILEPLPFLAHLAPMIRHHHERVDGNGYPDGLKGDDIPLGARILAVCDAFETMIAGRAGLPPVGLEEAAVQLKAGAGSRFDATVAEALVAAVSDEPTILDNPLGSAAELIHFARLFADQPPAGQLAPWAAASF